MRLLCLWMLLTMRAALYPVAGQQVIPLYDGAIPNSIAAANREEQNQNQGVREVSIPSLTLFLPEKGNGAAVLICPGGGYTSLVMKREGYDVAEQFIKRGVTAFVLKYRLPSDRIMKDKTIGPLQDAQQALRTIREKAKEWRLDPDRVGIMGFSAGGHLASSVGTHFKSPLIDNPRLTNLRPDFMILVYPVISFQDHLFHPGSREKLLGATPSKQKVDWFSNELQVTPTTPPTFLVHAQDDVKVPVGNSLAFYEALLHEKVMAELHLYAKGGHGFHEQPSFEEWFGRCTQWMKEARIIP